MSKNILIIEGSARKHGNSDLLCDSFIKGAIEKNHHVEKVYLSDKQIHFCNGCESCSIHHKCVFNDDMQELLQKIIDADVIVLATPTYFYSMSGLMKNFIDRCVARYTEIKDKDFYFFAVAADKAETIDRVMNALQGFTDCLDNANIKVKLKVGDVWKKGAIANNKAIEEAYLLGLYV
ncbi:MAG: flavodoxin family protein [Succinivibrionaceae bacterium]